MKLKVPDGKLRIRICWDMSEGRGVQPSPRRCRHHSSPDLRFTNATIANLFWVGKWPNRHLRDYLSFSGQPALQSFGVQRVVQQLWFLFWQV